jgi:hypothetical protein
METNDEKRKLIRSQFAALVSDLPKELGQNWKLTRYKNDTPWYAEITHLVSGALSLHLGEWKGRVSIAGVYDDRVEGRQVWYKSSSEPWPSISVAVTREAKAVAREVERRLLPDYSRLHAECEKRVAEYKTLLAASKATAELVAQMIGGKVYHTEGSYEYEVNAYRSTKLPEQSFDIKVSGTDITFDRLCVDRAVAEQILAVLVRNHKNNVEA